MKSVMRNALLAAAGLVALSLPASAAGAISTAQAPLVKPSTSPLKMAQRPYDPSAGSVGFRNENPGGVGYKKSAKKKKKVSAKK
jgi:hypothetical protein